MHSVFFPRMKKNPAVVTCTADIRTKMIFVEGENMSFRVDLNYEPHQPTPSIPFNNKRALTMKLNNMTESCASKLRHVLSTSNKTWNNKENFTLITKLKVSRNILLK